MEEFRKIFKEHEEELEVSCPDYAVRVKELMQKDLLAGNRVGSRYSKNFSEDITARCGNPADPKKKKNKSLSLVRKPAASLSLEDRIKLQLNEKMAEDREMSQLVAMMEEQILNEQEVEETPAKAVCSDNHFIPMCDDCGERHLQEHRECHFCGEVHEGCCEL